MRILALDLSTHCGYAVFDGDMGAKPTLLTSGTIDLDKPLHSFGPYPKTYRACARYMAALIYVRVAMYKPEVVIIEEINNGRDRYVQKLLENIHSAVCDHFEGFVPSASIVYLNSDGGYGWRTSIGLVLSKEQKRLNARLSKAKRECATAGVKLDKGKLGIKGKTNKKHLAVARANDEYNLKLKQKDNNEADAICLGLAYCNGCSPCDGVR